MRKIVRPMSTTIIEECMFHLIKDETEMKNVMAGVDESRIKQFKRGVDPESYQPLLYFWIDEGKTVFESKKYVAPMQIMMGDAK